jgi:hypothetical protein
MMRPELEFDLLSTLQCQAARAAFGLQASRICPSDRITAVTKFDPIFVHASMRSGSTYFYNVLRRNRSLMCFNEAIMDQKREYARFKRKNPDAAYSNKGQKWDINHHFLDRDDYHEFVEAWDAATHLCPDYPELKDYLPPNGVLSVELSAYLSALVEYARSQGKRPVLCEVNSRGRAGALRSAFGGFHIAQFRDPLSQFGSLIRGLIDGGIWSFLATPAMELGASRAHPLYCLVPELCRVPNVPWRVKNRGQFWASNMEYFAAIASPRPQAIENAFRWHLYSWFLTNLAAISYSDLVLDIDKVHDDADYRTSIIGKLAREIGSSPDFTDLKKFGRYYEFESFDIASVCQQVAATVSDASGNGHLEDALATLGSQAPTIPAGVAVQLLLTKLRDSLAAMAKSPQRRRMSAEEWRAIAEKNRKIWFNPIIRRVAEHVYPFAAPVVWAARRAKLWN